MAPIILFCAALVACLGTMASAGNTTLRKAAYAKFQGPYKYGIRAQRLNVWHIMSSTTPSGLANRNAADVLGDFTFIFGAKESESNPRGVQQYYHGVIEMRQVSVSSWGDYLQCNHPSGSTTYTCKCPKAHSGKCDMHRAGKEKNSHTDGHVWYSFPKAGEGKYWSYVNGKGSDSIIVDASCVIKKLASAAGCAGQCDDPKNAKKCTACVHWLLGTATTRKLAERTWDEATLGKGCPDSRRRRGHKLSYPEEVSNVTVSSVIV